MINLKNILWFSALKFKALLYIFNYDINKVIDWKKGKNLKFYNHFLKNKNKIKNKFFLGRVAFL